LIFGPPSSGGVVYSCDSLVIADLQLAAKYTRALVSILLAISPTFQQNQQLLKFKILDFVIATLSLLMQFKESSDSLRQAISAELEKSRREGAWPETLKQGIKDILVSKVGEEISLLAFKFFSC